MVSNALVDDKLVVTSSEVRSASPPESAPEVSGPAKRRYRTAAFKLRVIAEADACEQRGDVGSLLRREGVYHSDLATWRKQKAHGTLGGSRVPKSLRSDPEFQESLRQQAEMAREVRDLRRQLGRAKKIIEIQKKAALLLGETLQEISLDEPMEDEIG